ncbi:predicted protein [Plenodomus lingam JN3]|uniref:Predicted protein n=1 Tax=Leptosphaeria maculans (strain JN3 / isolate v23.1.3 / race Av1-4-5-6-7-8) TaxID=985895 RepID=E4ZI36_LEPMJ|nr:predicted protein [Plenodomus lingam JN3]CBX91179.1 predicted protein [Plenodomus lingam JN3]
MAFLALWLFFSSILSFLLFVVLLACFPFENLYIYAM